MGDSWKRIGEHAGGHIAGCSVNSADRCPRTLLSQLWTKADTNQAAMPHGLSPADMRGQL